MDERLSGPDDLRSTAVATPATARLIAVGVPGGGSDDASVLLRGIGPDSDEPDRAATFGLSNREREVLAQIAKGRTNREIGERLFISQKTVGVHVGNILGKLGVSGRVEAATVAIRLGLTERR